MWVMAITPREVGTDSHLRWVHCSRRSVGRRGCGSPPRSRPRCHARRSCWCRGVSRSGRTQSAPRARSAPAPLSPAGRQEGVSVGAGFWSVSWRTMHSETLIYVYTCHITDTHMNTHTHTHEQMIPPPPQHTHTNTHRHTHRHRPTYTHTMHTCMHTHTTHAHTHTLHEHTHTTHMNTYT